MSGRHLLRPTHSRPAPRPASNHHRLALPSSPSSPTVPRHSARLSHIPSSGPLPSGPICSQGRTNFSFRLVRSSPQRHPQVTSATFYASRCLASSLMFSSSNSFQAITLARNFACFRTPCRKSLSPCDPVGLIIAYLSGARLFGLPWTSWAPPRPYLYISLAIFAHCHHYCVRRYASHSLCHAYFLTLRSRRLPPFLPIRGVQCILLTRQSTPDPP